MSQSTRQAYREACAANHALRPDRRLQAHDPRARARAACRVARGGRRAAQGDAATTTSGLGRAATGVRRAPRLASRRYPNCSDLSSRRMLPRATPCTRGRSYTDVGLRSAICRSDSRRRRASSSGSSNSRAKTVAMNTCATCHTCSLSRPLIGCCPRPRATNSGLRRHRNGHWRVANSPTLPAVARTTGVRAGPGTKRTEIDDKRPFLAPYGDLAYTSS